ncbi:MAG TPA: FtsQ-type POTRA domain-containing protein [Dissulfurispiraceae bacterium]|nr:FtsQ-type POTRA domain-containing protein [Dissulfurispiraceae bacterium]
MDTRKGTKKQTGIKKSLAAIAGLAAILCLIGTVFLCTKFMFVREINFFGNKHLTTADLLSLTGLSYKKPLFSITTREIYKKLKTSPWIKDALVRKDLSGNITIYLTEAVAEAVLLVNDKPFLVDSEGTRLEHIKPESLYFLPVVKINPTSHKDAYLDALELATALNERKVAAHGGNIELTGIKPEDVTMKVDGVPVKIGAGDLQSKLEKLDFVRNELAKRNMEVEYIDLRFADRIVVKPLKNPKDPEKKPEPKAAEKNPKKPKEKQKNPKEKQKNPVHKKGDKKTAGGKTKRNVG